MPISLSGSLNLSGSLTTTGTITATTLVVETITSSISSITGSTNFGSLAANTHTFTGSVSVSGSGTFTSALSGTSATFSGTGYSVFQGSAHLQTAASTGLSFGYNRSGANGESTIVYGAPAAGFNFEIASVTSGTITPRLTITNAGAATFSSSVSTGAALTVTGTNSTSANNTITGYSADLYAVAVRQKGASAGISGTNFMAQIISATGAEGLEIYTPNSKELILGTNATARLTIGTTGAATFSSSVTATQGIFSLGTVGGAIASVKNLAVLNTNGAIGDWAGINFGYYNSGTTFGYIGTIVTSDATNSIADLVFGVKASTSATAVTEYMRIKGGGNVGIGTSSPSRTLDVNGTFRVVTPNRSFFVTTNAYSISDGTLSSGFGMDGDGLYLGNVTSSTGWTISNPQVTIRSNGNVGIGTSSPNATLSLYGASTAYMNFRNSTNISSTYGFVIEATGNESELWNYASGYMRFGTANTERMRITSGGDYLFNTTTASYGFYVRDKTAGFIYNGRAQGGSIWQADNNVYNSIVVYSTGADGYNGAGTAIILGKNTSTNRSINAGGTINASGADYAEYMTKAVEDTIEKGDIVGVDENGLLTNIFNNAKSFVVKSTDPSYVGGDTWGSVDDIGKLPTDATDEQKAEHEAKLEEARTKVDRIAFSGQVPCNVTGANVGDYIIPIELENGKIGGQAVTNPTFEQYRISVGKVWKIMEDGRAWIAVKIG